MKILFFVDTHDDKEALARLAELAKKQKVDLLVCAGDISEFGKDLRANIKSMDIGKRMLIIPGNHEDADDINKAIKGLKWVTSIHKKSLCVGGVLFLGCGGGGLSEYNTQFERSMDSFKKAMEVFSGKVVLVLHGPPYNTKLDTLGIKRLGVKSVRQFIEAAQPDYAICGHFHETAGKQDKVGKTVIINPGKDGVVLEL